VGEGVGPDPRPAGVSGRRAGREAVANTGLSAAFGVSLAATGSALYMVHDSSARTKQILWTQLLQP
jgi:hypothetical protein